MVLSVAVIAITLPWKILIVGIGKQTSPFKRRKRGGSGRHRSVLHGTVSSGGRHRSAVKNSDRGYRKTNKSSSAKEQVRCKSLQPSILWYQPERL